MKTEAELRAVPEKTIEKKVCDYGKGRFEQRKFVSPQFRSCSDRLFALVAPLGEKFFMCVFFIEFKRYGKEPTPAQLREHARWATCAVPTFIIDTVADGENLLDYIATTGVLPPVDTYPSRHQKF